MEPVFIVIEHFATIVAAAEGCIHIHLAINKKHPRYWCMTWYLVRGVVVRRSSRNNGGSQ